MGRAISELCCEGKILQKIIVKLPFLGNFPIIPKGKYWQPQHDCFISKFVLKQSVLEKGCTVLYYTLYSFKK